MMAEFSKWLRRPHLGWLAVFLLVFVFPTSISAQAAQPVSLAEAIDSALQNNHVVHRSKAKIETARAKILEARGAEDLDIRATVFSERGREDGPTSLGEFGLSSSISQPLPVGGRVGLSFEHSDSRPLAQSDESADVEPSVQPGARLWLALPLLAGAGLTAARHSIRAAEADAEIAALEGHVTAATLVRDVIVAWAELAAARESLTIIQGSLQDARQQLEVVEAYIRAGKLSPCETGQLEVTIALREEAAHIAAQHLRKRSRDMSFLMGRESDRAEQLVPERRLESQLSQNVPAVTRDDEVDRAPQLELVQAQIDAAQSEVEVARRGKLPELDLVVGFGLTGWGDEGGPAYRSLGQRGAPSVDAALSLKLPVQRRRERGRYARELSELHELQIEADARSTHVELALADARDQSRTARRRADLLARAIESARADLQAERARFEAGRATTFDVLRRQEELTVARLRRVRALADGLTAIARCAAYVAPEGL